MNSKSFVKGIEEVLKYSIINHVKMLRVISKAWYIAVNNHCQQFINKYPAFHIFNSLNIDRNGIPLQTSNYNDCNHINSNYNYCKKCNLSFCIDSCIIYIQNCHHFYCLDCVKFQPKCPTCDQIICCNLTSCASCELEVCRNCAHYITYRCVNDVISGAKGDSYMICQKCNTNIFKKLKI